MLFDPNARPAPRRHRRTPAAPPFAATAGLLLATGLAYWLLSRASQPAIDDRTRQRLTPRSEGVR